MELMCAVASFKIKLEMYITQIKGGDLTHVPQLNEPHEGSLESDKLEIFVALVQQLQEKFVTFCDFMKLESAGVFLQDPYTFPILNKDLDATFNVPRQEQEEEQSDFQDREQCTQHIMQVLFWNYGKCIGE